MRAPTAAMRGLLVIRDMKGESHGRCGAAEALAAPEKERRGEAGVGVASGPRAPSLRKSTYEKVRPWWRVRVRVRVRVGVRVRVKGER